MRRPAFAAVFGTLVAASVASAAEPSSTEVPPDASPSPQPRVVEVTPSVRDPLQAMPAVTPNAPTHAPTFSLWVGPRIGFIGFGSNFFDNEPRRNQPSSTESTGNFIGNGMATELDIGVRLARRWIPYVFYEHGFMGQGHRFAGSNASASTDSYGIGLRIGGADRVGFISDLSIGQRVVRVSNGGETFTMTALEVFKLALGAEFRLQTLFTIEATVSASGGSMSDSTGDVLYGPEGNLDGRTRPAFKNGSLDRNSETYVVLGAGVGIHFDIFGQ